mmetsp:Transcript_32282/g.63065  ORF Transcript_32282/g.63065 Transcript_32282/m.63065 type:complete len:90 (-) Transcript_32282:582-851(-)
MLDGCSLLSRVAMSPVRKVRAGIDPRRLGGLEDLLLPNATSKGDDSNPFNSENILPPPSLLSCEMKETECRHLDENDAFRSADFTDSLR